MPNAVDWCYAPSCECDRCEDYKLASGMTMRYPLASTRPAADERPHRGFLR